MRVTHWSDTVAVTRCRNGYANSLDDGNHAIDLVFVGLLGRLCVAVVVYFHGDILKAKPGDRIVINDASFRQDHALHLFGRPVKRADRLANRLHREAVVGGIDHKLRGVPVIITNLVDIALFVRLH